jgi:aldehyde:ferredoxin oxidoreductase
MRGFYGRILTINLTDESFEIETLREEICGQVLGGKGLATHLLLTKNASGVDPLSAENHLIFATGPVCPSDLWGSSRKSRRLRSHRPYRHRPALKARSGGSHSGFSSRLDA